MNTENESNENMESPNDYEVLHRQESKSIYRKN